MNVSTITMPRDQALAKLREYTNATRRSTDERIQRAREAFKRLADGTALISLADVFRNTPRDAQLRPRLAFARSDRLEVCYRVIQRWTDGGYVSLESFDSAFYHRSGPTPARCQVEIACAPDVPHPPVGTDFRYATVPHVPPRVRRGHDLTHRFTLWEVDQWRDRPTTAPMDKDPYLLEHLAGDLYAVVGEWDLTDLERAIFAPTPR